MRKPKFFSILKHRKRELSKEQLLKDTISGVIVAIIALPLSVALGISSGVSPEKGLITAIIAGFLISFLGGSRVQIGGPTGAFVVIIYAIIEKYGIEGLVIATLMAGVILIIFGLLKFGSLIKYIPYPITVGFTAGIAVTLFGTQIKDFFGLIIQKTPSEFIPKWKVYFENLHTINYVTLLIGIGSLLILVLWPKINKKIPGSLIALIVATVITYIFNLPIETIGSQFGEISSKIPMPTLPLVNLEVLRDLIKPATTIAILAGLESLLSAVVSDGMIGKKHDSNMELIAQGIANIGSALFGGIPATGAIARTAANVKNGGRTPIAGIIHAITLLLIMKIFMPFAKFIPLTTLAAILMVVSYNMSEWRTFKAMLKAPKSDIAILIVTFVLTVVFDLVIAIEAGMIVALILFMVKMSRSIEVNELDEDDLYEFLDFDNTNTENIGDNILIYDINGAFFFGAVEKFMDVMREIDATADVLILRMRWVPVMDATAYSMIRKVEERCKKDNIKVIICELQEKPNKLLNSMDSRKLMTNLYTVITIEEAIDKANRLARETAI